MEKVAQIIGIVAVVTFLLSYQQKKRKNIILLNATSRILYIIQYILLGAFSGAVLDVLGAVSSIIAGNKHKGFIKKHPFFCILAINFLMTIAGVAIALKNESWIDLFSLAGVLLHTSAFWLTNEKHIRRVSLIGSPCWLIYNFSSRAYGSAVGDLLSICSIVIAMIRYRKNTNTNESL